MLTKCNEIGQNNELRICKVIHVHINKNSNDFVNFAMDSEIKAK